jgi:APA family basic amino acid/polyamine antiporter
VAAFLSIVVAEFLHRLGVLQGIAPPMLAMAVLVIFWAVNWTGTRIAGDSQIGFSALKGTALIGLVVLLFAQPGVETNAAQPSAQLSGTIGIAAIAIAMRAIINTYDGWQDVVYFSEEMEDPGRTLPRSMALGVGSVVVLYLLVNLALLHVLSPAQMAASALPAADAAKVALGPSGDVALTIFAVLSVAAITNVTIMKTARIAYALARAGQLPQQLSQVSASGTPRIALTVSTLLAALFAATGTYETVVAMNVAVGVAIVILVNVAAVSLRRQEPDLPRPFRIPLYPVPILIAVAVNLTLLAALIYEDPLHSLAGFAFLIAIALVYSMLARSQRAAPV